MKNIKIENFIVIIGIFSVLVLINSSFLAYCSQDPISNFINAVGSWSIAALWQSSKVFCVYAIADIAWNINYVGPRIFRSFFLIKGFDRLNAMLSLQSRSDLEEYIEQTTYTPLHSSFTQFFYPTIIVPFKSSLGFKEIVPDVVVSRRPTITTIQQTVYVPALSSTDLNELKENIQTIEENQISFQNTLSSNYHAALDRFDNILRRDGNNLVPLDFLSPFLVSTYFNNKLLLNVDTELSLSSEITLSSGRQAQFVHEINPVYPNAFTPHTIQLINQDPEIINWSNSIDNWALEIGGDVVVPNTLNFMSGYRPMLSFPCSYEIPLASVLPLTDKSHEFVLYLQSKSDQPIELILKDTNIYVAGFRTGPVLEFSDAMQSLKAEVTNMSAALNNVSAAFTALCATAVGIVAHSGDITAMLDAINLLGENINNPELGIALTQTFINYGQPVPDILQQYAQHCNSVATPQEAISSVNINAISGSIPPKLPDLSVLIYATGYVIAAGVVVSGLYYLYTKTGIDPDSVSTAKEGVKSALNNFSASVKNKYIN